MREAAGHTELGKRAKPIRKRLKAVCAVVRDWPQEKRKIIAPGRTNAYPRDAYSYMAIHLFKWAEDAYGKWSNESRADIALLEEPPIYWTNFDGLRTTLAHFVKGHSNWTTDHLATIEKWLPVIEAHVLPSNAQEAAQGHPAVGLGEAEAADEPPVALQECPTVGRQTCEWQPGDPAAYTQPEDEFDAAKAIKGILSDFGAKTQQRIISYVGVWMQSQKEDNAT